MQFANTQSTFDIAICVPLFQRTNSHFWPAFHASLASKHVSASIFLSLSTYSPSFSQGKAPRCDVALQEYCASFANTDHVVLKGRKHKHITELSITPNVFIFGKFFSIQPPRHRFIHLLFVRKMLDWHLTIPKEKRTNHDSINTLNAFDIA